MPFKRNYEIIKDAPKEIEWEQYCEKAMEEYQMLLQDSPDNERVFQNFFEENPSFCRVDWNCLDIRGIIHIWMH